MQFILSIICNEQLPITHSFGIWLKEIDFMLDNTVFMQWKVYDP